MVTMAEGQICFWTLSINWGGYNRNPSVIRILSLKANVSAWWSSWFLEGSFAWKNISFAKGDKKTMLVWSQTIVLWNLWASRGDGVN